jgi:hypothetical protein
MAFCRYPCHKFFKRCSKDDGTYVVEFRPAAGDVLATIPRAEAQVIRHVQERMPYGLLVGAPAIDLPTQSYNRLEERRSLAAFRHVPPHASNL